MKTKRYRSIVVVFSCVALTVSPSAMAAPPVVIAKRVMQAPRDVALHEGGVLVGQMLDAQGVAVAGAPIAVQTAGKEIARFRTDLHGQFRVAGLRGGVHQVNTVDQQAVYRLWAPNSAPPAAQQGLMLVSSTDVKRGQCDCGTPACGAPVCGSSVGGGAGGGSGIGNWIANHPLITAGAIGAAIAVPLALDDDDNPPATP